MADGRKIISIFLLVAYPTQGQNFDRDHFRKRLLFSCFNLRISRDVFRIGAILKELYHSSRGAKRRVQKLAPQAKILGFWTQKYQKNVKKWPFESSNLDDNRDNFEFSDMWTGTTGVKRDNLVGYAGAPRRCPASVPLNLVIFYDGAFLVTFVVP